MKQLLFAMIFVASSALATPPSGNLSGEHYDELPPASVTSHHIPPGSGPMCSFELPPCS